MTGGAIGASVLVPVLNEEAHIEQSIEAMLGQRFDRPLEILVMEGGSNDRTPEIVAQLARRDDRVRVLANPKRRIPHALNIGLRQARGEYIVRMDAHAYYPPEYIARAVERFEVGDVECVSGPPSPHGDGKWSRRIALALRTPLGVGAASFRNATRETEVDTAFTGVWRRSRLLELGGWDERWTVNEDAELAARIREAGGRYVCLPAMAARWVPRDSIAALARQYFRYGQYRAKTARHHPKGLRATHLLPPAVAVLLTAGALAPTRPRRVARLMLLPYGAALVAGSAVAAGDDVPATDLASLPVVFATMHVTWGAGFIVGSLRFGPPVTAVARLLTTARSRR
jgi:glycosyltransferase involved in cell wall biosynthesis